MSDLIFVVEGAGPENAWPTQPSRIQMAYHTWGVTTPRCEHFIFKFDPRDPITPAEMTALAARYPGSTVILGEEPNYASVDLFAPWYHERSAAWLAGDPTAQLIFGYLVQDSPGVYQAPIPWVRAFWTYWQAQAGWPSVPPAQVIHANYFPPIGKYYEGAGYAVDNPAMVTHYADLWHTEMTTGPAAAWLAPLSLSIGTGFRDSLENAGASNPAQASINAWMTGLIQAFRNRTNYGFVSHLMNFPGYCVETVGGAPRVWASSLYNDRGALSAYGRAVGAEWVIEYRLCHGT